MSYNPISLPESLNADLARIVRKDVDTFLSDAHNMFLLPVAGGRNARGGCNFPIVTTLVGVLAGLSVLDEADTEKGRGDKFKKFIRDYYPDESHLPGAMPKDVLASALWDLYRCPLEHSLGRFNAPTRRRAECIFGIDKITAVRVDKGRLEDADISRAGALADLGRPAFSDQGPTLWIDSENKLKLTARVFYWGTRQAIIKWAEDQVQKASTTRTAAPTVSRFQEPRGPTAVSAGSTDSTTPPGVFPSREKGGSAGSR